MSEAALAFGDVTDDGFLGGRLHVLQPKRGFRAAIDSVLLPAAIEAENGLDILDAGLGTGVAALCLVARDPSFCVTGIESQAELAALAAENGKRNNLTIDIQCTDFLSRAPSRLFDQVMTNPPYFESSEGTQSPVKSKARANAGPGIAEWLEACLAHLKPGGVLTLIHRAEREADTLAALTGRAGDAQILPLIPRLGETPKRVLVRARLGATGQVQRCAGFVLHGDSTKYAELAEDVLRHGAALSWRNNPS